MINQLISAAFVLAAASIFPAYGLAAMLGAVAPAVVPDTPMVVPASGCHSRAEFHYVPEFGYRTRHFHRGPRCRAIEHERFDDDEDFRCHRDAARHYHRDYGRTLHRHSRRDCDVRELRRNRDRRNGEVCVQIGPLLYCEN